MGYTAEKLNEALKEIDSLKAQLERAEGENLELYKHGVFYHMDSNKCKIICNACHAWCWDGHDDESVNHKGSCLVGKVEALAAQEGSRDELPHERRT